MSPAVDFHRHVGVPGSLGCLVVVGWRVAGGSSGEGGLLYECFLFNSPPLSPDWSVLLWVCCVGFNLYVNVVHRIDTQKWELYYHSVSWGWPMLMAVIPLGTNSYGPAGAWCWIDRNSWMRFALWYVPLVICIIGLIVLYSLLTYRVNRQINEWQGTYNPETEGEKLMLRKYIEPLRFYPVVYILTATFPVINRIQNAANPCDPVFALFLLHSLSAPMMGMLNAVVYARSGGFWKSLTWTAVKRAFQRLVHPQRVKEYPIDIDDDTNLIAGDRVPVGINSSAGAMRGRETDGSERALLDETLDIADEA
eukprot:m.67929 g.67929  ORF g.67929 m.67929 type:complete len:308 (-) comp13870_c0_seq3:237-1160(-)